MVQHSCTFKLSLHPHKRHETYIRAEKTTQQQQKQKQQQQMLYLQVSEFVGNQFSLGGRGARRFRRHVHIYL